MDNNNKMIPFNTFFTLEEFESMDLRLSKEVFKVMEGFQELYPRITVHQAMLLLAVHQNNGETQAVIARKAGMLATTASKHTKMYSHTNIYKKPGFGFLTMTQDPLNNNYNIIELTEKGKKFLEDL